MPMTKQPYGTRRIPKVARAERPINPDTGKPEVPMEYVIMLPTEAGDKPIGSVQRVPNGSKTGRDFWRPWPASLPEGSAVPEVIKEDAAYIRAIEVLVEAWNASAPEAQSAVTPEQHEAHASAASTQASGDGDLFGNPVQPTPLPIGVVADERMPEGVAVLVDQGEVTAYVEARFDAADGDVQGLTVPGSPAHEAVMGIDLSGVAVLGGITPEEAAAVPAESVPDAPFTGLISDGSEYTPGEAHELSRCGCEGGSGDCFWPRVCFGVT